MLVLYSDGVTEANDTTKDESTAKSVSSKC